MGRYRVQDEACSEEFDAADDDAALAHAEQWLAEGDWGEQDKTIFLTASVFSMPDDERIGGVQVSLHPDPPKCSGSKHVWCSPYELMGGLRENPGVSGKGGGVTIKSVCSECGAYRFVDTWTTRPTDGSQGHTSVKYSPADEESLAWKEQLTEAE